MYVCMYVRTYERMCVCVVACMRACFSAYERVSRITTRNIEWYLESKQKVNDQELIQSHSTFHP